MPEQTTGRSAELNRALEVLKDNLERIFDHPVTLEDAHLVAATVSMLISVGFDELETAHALLHDTQNINNVRKIMRAQQQRAAQELVRQQERGLALAAEKQKKIDRLSLAIKRTNLKKNQLKNTHTKKGARI